MKTMFAMIAKQSKAAFLTIKLPTNTHKKLFHTFDTVFAPCRVAQKYNREPKKINVA